LALVEDVALIAGGRVGVRGHQNEPGGTAGLAAIGQRFHRRDAGAQEGQPVPEHQSLGHSGCHVVFKPQFFHLLARWLGQAEREHVDAVHVSHEMVEKMAIVGSSGEFPNAHVALVAKGTLSSNCVN